MVELNVTLKLKYPKGKTKPLNQKQIHSQTYCRNIRAFEP